MTRTELLRDCTISATAIVDHKSRDELIAYIAELMVQRAEACSALELARGQENFWRTEAQRMGERLRADCAPNTGRETPGRKTKA